MAETIASFVPAVPTCRVRLLISLVACIAWHCGYGSSWAAEPVRMWTRWEHSLESSKDYSDPSADVLVTVTYQGPHRQIVKGLAFCERGKTYRFHAMFPASGTWTWRTECSDAGNVGLQQQTGSVEVAPYKGDNRLYQHGYLRVSDSHRYLVYADGTPFLWIGDTAWAAPMNATWDAWKAYVHDRVQKHFTVVQIFCASDWAGDKDTAGNPPFVNHDITKLNAAYWRQYQQKVEYANEQGLVVLVVGLMEPLERYPTAQSAKQFARQLVARLSGNFVIFSPSFDSRYKQLGDIVGQCIRESTSQHLIAQHPGTNLPAARAYQSKSYTDLCGLQSGAGWGSNPISPETAAHTAVQWSLDLWHRRPVKPIIDLEARYDSDFGAKQLSRLPRSCGYWSLLSGCTGYTYGSAGLWNWGLTDKKNWDSQETPWTWQEGLNRPSSTEIKHLAVFFERLPWWTLEPHHELILNQADSDTRHMVLAMSRQRNLAVAYLPDNASIQVDLTPLRFNSAPAVSWFNPLTGDTHNAAAGDTRRELRRIQTSGNLARCRASVGPSGAIKASRYRFGSFRAWHAPLSNASSRRFPLRNAGRTTSRSSHPSSCRLLDEAMVERKLFILSSA